MMSTDQQQAMDDTGKFVFDDYYDRPDPQAYYRTLGQVDYCIPGEAQPLFRKTIDALRQSRDLARVKAVDIGCSYGVNAALARCELELDDLYDHYHDPAIDALSRDELLARDISFYEENCVNADIDVIGVDPAANAIRYAVDAGTLAGGITTNLEDDPATPSDEQLLQGIDLVMSTGAIGYASEKTVRQLLDADEERRPWLANFVLRMFPYDRHEALLDERGYVTEKLDQTFVQRRFANDEERANVLGNLEELGIDPDGKESDGWYHAEFFLSRPAEEARTPIAF